MKMNIKFVKNNLTELNSYVGFIVLLISMYVFESTAWTSFNDSFFHDILLGCALLFAISCFWNIDVYWCIMLYFNPIYRFIINVLGCNFDS